MEKNYDKQTGEIKSSVRCYHSFDFGSAEKRLKEDLNNWKNGPYIVHVEDYESINDMVRRCVKTKTKLPIESNPLATYDTDEDIAAQLPEYAAAEQRDQSSTAGIEQEQEQAVAEQSEGKASSNSGSSALETMP